MLILSNCLTEVADEGSLKVATNIVNRIKRKDKSSFVISYDRRFAQTDIFLPINKLLLNRELISIIKSKKQPVLYIPFPAPSLTTALRIRILSLFARCGLKVMLVQQRSMSRISRMILRSSKAEVIAISKQAYDFYHAIVGDKATYLKTGVDTERFVPVSSEKVKELKVKYGFDPERPLVLHVGHLKYGRNVGELMKIDKRYQVLLVTSTLFKDEQDEDLKVQLLNHSNIKIFDEYASNIEEIYQMSDVYFFPVQELGNCIDVPLSCLEAASCNKPIITTDYGEMKSFVGKHGFYFLDSMDSDHLNNIIQQASAENNCYSRSAVLEYDWNNAVYNSLDMH